MVEKEAKSANEQLDPVLEGSLPAYASVCPIVGDKILRVHRVYGQGRNWGCISFEILQKCLVIAAAILF